MSIDVTGPLRSSYLAILLTIFGGERDERKGMSDDRAPDRNPTGVAGGAARAARCREGAHAAGRRARPPAPGASVGAGREGVQLRDRRRDQAPPGALRRSPTAARLPLHVRPGIRGRLPGLLIDRGQPERQSPPPESTRHHPDLLVEGALGQAPGLPEADGLELRLGFDGRPRLPP